MIKMIDTAKQNLPILDKISAAISEVVESGVYINGPAIPKFESEVAAYLGVKHAIACSSGTDALLMALMVLDIKGADVICPSFTFFATAGVISRAGANPIFADIDPNSFNIIDDLEQYLTPNTKAIIPVHLYGQSANMNHIMQFANKHGLFVIEDACQAIGSEYNGKKVGTIGDMGAYSFFPTKNLGALGDAGLIVTDDDLLAEKLKSCRNHGSPIRYYHDFVGGNFRMDTLQAAVLSVKLPYLPDYQLARQLNAAYYLDNLSDLHEIILPKHDNGHVFNQFTIRVKHGRRDELMNFLRNNGVGCEVYYPLPLHKQKCYNSDIVLPNTDIVASEVLSLPVAPEVDLNDVKTVVSVIKRWAND